LNRGTIFEERSVAVDRAAPGGIRKSRRGISEGAEAMLNSIAVIRIDNAVAYALSSWAEYAAARS